LAYKDLATGQQEVVQIRFVFFWGKIIFLQDNVGGEFLWFNTMETMFKKFFMALDF
jgi:hypothetical protein